MKNKITITLISLMFLAAGCQDELIATAEDRDTRQEEIEVPVTDTKSDSVNDSVEDPWSTQGTPIGFTIIVKDYEETEVNTEI